MLMCLPCFLQLTGTVGGEERVWSCLHNSWGYLHKLRTKISVATGYLDISKLIIVTKLPEAITGENEAENCAAIIVLSFQGYPAAS